MANRSRNSAQQGSSKNQDDTKFYIKFKDPRIKSQIFYYFDDTDIFDPCIPLNNGDIVTESHTIDLKKKNTPTQQKSKSPKPLESKTLAAPTVAPAPTKSLKADSVPTALKVDSSVNDQDLLDDSFEDVGYMTAMDMKYVDPDESQNESDEDLPILEEEEVVLEEIKVPTREITSGVGKFDVRTAIEPIQNNDNDILLAVNMSKEEFDMNTQGKGENPYHQWLDIHIKKSTIPSRAITAAEFRLLKKVIGIKKK